MSELLSEILFNRALMWLLMASVADNEKLRMAFVIIAILNVGKSLRASMEAGDD